MVGATSWHFGLGSDETIAALNGKPLHVAFANVLTKAVQLLPSGAPQVQGEQPRVSIEPSRMGSLTVWMRYRFGNAGMSEQSVSPGSLYQTHWSAPAGTLSAESMHHVLLESLHVPGAHALHPRTYVPQRTGGGTNGTGTEGAQAPTVSGAMERERESSEGTLVGAVHCPSHPGGAGNGVSTAPCPSPEQVREWAVSCAGKVQLGAPQVQAGHVYEESMSNAPSAHGVWSWGSKSHAGSLSGLSASQTKNGNSS